MHKRLSDLLIRARRDDGSIDGDELARLADRRLADFERELATEQHRMNAALDSTGHAISIYDRNRRLVHCNNRFLELYGLPQRLGRRGTPFETILRGRIAANSHAGTDPERYVAERLALAERGLPATEITQLNTGQMVSVTHQPLADGGWVSTHKDITEFNRLQEELAHFAFSDALTGLANRHLLHQRLSECLGVAGRHVSFALLLMDLDGFKTINDTLGHSGGDQTLKAVAQRIEAVVGEAGLAARMGGDEFAVVMDTGALARDAHLLALRLTEAAREPLIIDGHNCTIGISIGIAMAPTDGTSADTLLKNADLALYAAKEHGGSSYRFFEPAMDQARRDRRQMERDLAVALEGGQFELHYQPILNLKEQLISGCEALLRWNHPERGLISPADFIPVAEESGLIVPIGEWVLRQAIAEAARWPRELRVAINVSSVQFQHGNVVGTIMNALGAAGLAPERVEIEITESVFFENTAANLEALRQLHALGVKLALDDFGTGFSALSYLLSYPFDKIKIDGSFIRAIDSGAAAQAIVRAVAEIGHRIGIVTTAEGIETAEQLRNVHAAGYNEAQGYLIARPMVTEQLHRMLRGEEDGMPFAPLERRAS